jgi:hypothetical protein
LLLIPATVFIGAFLGIGLMAGAIFSHLTILGIESNGDGGQLFIIAVVVLVSCFILCLMNWQQGIKLLNSLLKK